MTTVAPEVRENVPADPPETLLGRFAWPSLDGIVLTICVLVCVRIGMEPLQDNSFLTHLATGRLILDEGSVPTTDPYSWTALGREWTVQSWLASVIYAGLEDLVGLGGVRVLATGLVVALTVLLWKLTDVVDGLLGRAVAILLALMVGVGVWVERPLMFGAVGLAFLLLAAEGRVDPRWLVPVIWIWANTHGSFPFAPVVLVLLGVGRFLDDRRRPDVEIRCLVWTTVGIALAVVSPLGTKVLTFPFQLLENREAFSQIKEWQPIDLALSNSRIFLVQLLVAAVALLRVRRWRAILPTVVFAVAAVTSARNIVQASIVFTPVIAAGLKGLGSIAGSRRPRLAGPVMHALVVVTVVFTVMQLGQSHTGLRPYPQEALTWMRDQGMLDTSSRIVTRDVVGNYMEFAYGPDEVRVFIDDRVDMYPVSLINSYLDLLKEGRDHESALQELDPTVVLWDKDSKLGRWLEQTDRWNVVWEDPTWLVAVPE